MHPLQKALFRVVFVLLFQNQRGFQRGNEGLGGSNLLGDGFLLGTCEAVLLCNFGVCLLVLGGGGGGGGGRRRGRISVCVCVCHGLVLLLVLCVCFLCVCVKEKVRGSAQERERERGGRKQAEVEQDGRGCKRASYACGFGVWYLCNGSVTTKKKVSWLHQR